MKWKRYNQGTADDVILTIAYPADLLITGIALYGDDCKRIFGTINSDCQKDNKVFGGAMRFPRYPIATIDPKEGAGNKKCYGTGTNSWVDANGLSSNMNEFCGVTGRKSKRDFSIGRKQWFNFGINRVMLELSLPSGVHVPSEECAKNFEELNAGCDGVCRYMIFSIKNLDADDRFRMIQRIPLISNMAAN